MTNAANVEMPKKRIQHITAGCPNVIIYLQRHNCVAGIIDQDLAFKIELLLQKLSWYKYKPQRAFKNENHRLYRNRTILTNRTITANRPSII